MNRTHLVKFLYNPVGKSFRFGLHIEGLKPAVPNDGELLTCLLRLGIDSLEEGGGLLVELLVLLAVFGAIGELLQFFDQSLKCFFHLSEDRLDVGLDELYYANLDVLLVDLAVHGEEVVHRVLY